MGLWYGEVCSSLTVMTVRVLSVVSPTQTACSSRPFPCHPIESTRAMVGVEQLELVRFLAR